MGKSKYESTLPEGMSVHDYYKLPAACVATEHHFVWEGHKIVRTLYRALIYTGVPQEGTNRYSPHEPLLHRTRWVASAGTAENHANKWIREHGYHKEGW